MTNLENAGAARVKPNMLGGIKNHGSHAGDGAFLAFMGYSQNVSSKQARLGEAAASNDAALRDEPRANGDVSANKFVGGDMHITVFVENLRPPSGPIAEAYAPPVAAAFSQESGSETLRTIAAIMPTDETATLTSLAAPENQSVLTAQKVSELEIFGQVTLDAVRRFAKAPLATTAQITNEDGRTARPNKAANQDHSTEAPPDTTIPANAIPMGAGIVTTLQPWPHQISTDQDRQATQSVQSIGQTDKAAFGQFGVETQHATALSNLSSTKGKFANAAVADKALTASSTALDLSQTEPHSRAPFDRVYQYGASETSDHGPTSRPRPQFDTQTPAATTGLPSPAPPSRPDDTGEDHKSSSFPASGGTKLDANVNQHLQKGMLGIEQDVQSNQPDLNTLRHTADSAMGGATAVKTTPIGPVAKPTLVTRQNSTPVAAKNDVKTDAPTQTPAATPEIQAKKIAALPYTYPDHLRQIPANQIAPMANQNNPKSEAETASLHANPNKTGHFATSVETSHETLAASLEQKTALYDIREPAPPIKKTTFFDTIAPSPALPGITSPTSATAAIAPHSQISVPISAVPLHIKTLLSADKPTTLELTLAPEELGKLRLMMVPEGDKIRIVIQAERPETLELLRRNTENFASDLRQSGYAEASFSFSGWNDHPTSTPTPKDERATHFSGNADEPSTKPKAYTAQIKGAGLDLRV